MHPVDALYKTVKFYNCKINYVWRRFLHSEDLFTYMQDNTLDPVWNERFHVPVCHRTSKLTFQIRYSSG